MQSDVRLEDLPLNLPEEEAILFGTTESGRAVYYSRRRQQLLIGFYDPETDVFDYSLRFDTDGIGDALDQLLELRTEVTLSVIAEAFQGADTDVGNAYVKTLLDAGFTAEDVATVMPLSEEQALEIAGTETEE